MTFTNGNVVSRQSCAYFPPFFSLPISRVISPFRWKAAYRVVPSVSHLSIIVEPFNTPQDDKTRPAVFRL
ncbi:hypothetical protein DAQ1742_02553 [Dickeya aquatica]|uniref:Uncharacterized protein n=1 Tax=Dickeya aquatica TaxID=1401087 RepID=A0A375ABW0_9GAMM|nr:hypothetical protein DAQ1742_02553 [Dickeya aquatica]